MTVRAFSPGKVIISGEHSAVYGQPALASAISLGLTVGVGEGQLDANYPYNAFVENVLRVFGEKFGRDVAAIFVKVNGDLPMGSGLGSSAALAHAILQAFAQKFSISISQDEMVALIQECEKFAHGHPSGLDATAVVRQGLLRFQRHGETFAYEPIIAPHFSDLSFFLIQSGKPRESTKEMIAFVKASLEAQPKLHTHIEALGKLTSVLIGDIKDDQFNPISFTENQRYLAEIGIVSDKAAAMIHDIELADGFAKVTGAGGRSEGSGMLLAFHPDTEKLTDLIHHKNWQSYQVKLGVS